MHPFAIGILMYDMGMAIKQVTPIEWPVVIESLTKAGFTQAEIGARCSLSQSSISELRRGRTREPCFSAGRALLDMQDEVTRLAAAGVRHAA